jgi:hypothetical protein
MVVQLLSGLTCRAHDLDTRYCLHVPTAPIPHIYSINSSFLVDDAPHHAQLLPLPQAK